MTIYVDSQGRIWKGAGGGAAWGSATAVQPLVITTPLNIPLTGTVGIPYTFSMGASGGQGSYVWSLLSPPGVNNWQVTSFGSLTSSNLVAAETDQVIIQVTDGVQTTSNTFFVTINNPVLSGSDDFSIRSTGPGVIWAHDFQNDAEFYNFWKTGTISNDTTLSADVPTLVATPFGNSRAIKSLFLGTVITANVAAGGPGIQQWWQCTSDIQQWPNPQSGTKSYKCIVGPANNDRTTSPVEMVLVTDIDYLNNRIFVTRVAEGSKGGGAYTANTTSVGMGPDGLWVRPFGAFPAVQNGKSVADIGILNAVAPYGAGDATHTHPSGRTWDLTPNGRSHVNFREAYYGHRDYWVDGTAPYKNWTSLQSGGTNPRVDAFDGSDFWIQFRVKISSGQMSHSTSRTVKLLYIATSALQGVDQQIFLPVGPSIEYSETVPPLERVASAYGQIGMMESQFGGGYSIQNRHTVTVPSGDWGDPIKVQDGYPLTKYVATNVTPFEGWCWPGDKWFTILIHVTPGLDNSIGSVGPAVTDPQNPLPANPQPGPKYLTNVEWWVCEEADSFYKTIASHNANMNFVFGDNQGAYGYYNSNPPAWNAVSLTPYCNTYLDGGGATPPTTTNSIQTTQAIFSKQWIPPPGYYILPAYMTANGQSGGPPMADFQVKTLTSPSNGKTYMSDVAPSDYASFYGETAEKCFAFSGGKGDANRRRLFVHGGGHSDGHDNGLFYFDFKGDQNPTGWVLCPNSASAAANTTSWTNGMNSNDFYPTAVHTYDQAWYDPNKNRYYRAGGYDYNSGIPRSVFYYDLIYNVWNTKFPPGSNPNAPFILNNSVGTGGTLFMDPRGQKMLVISDTQPTMMDCTNGTVIGNYPYPNGQGSPMAGHTNAYMTTIYDSKRDLYVVFIVGQSGTPAGGVFTAQVDWVNNTVTWPTVPSIPPQVTNFIGGGRSGFYDSAHDSYWLFGNVSGNSTTDTFMEIDATTFALKRTPQTISIIAGPSTNGGYNRFVWFPQWRIVGTVYSAFQPVSIIKLPA